MTEKDQEPAMVQWSAINTLTLLIQWVSEYSPNEAALDRFLTEGQELFEEGSKAKVTAHGLIMNSCIWDLENAQRLGLDYQPHVKLARLELKHISGPGNSVAYRHWAFVMREDCSDIASIVLLSKEESLQIQKATNDFAQ